MHSFTYAAKLMLLIFRDQTNLIIYKTSPVTVTKKAFFIFVASEGLFYSLLKKLCSGLKTPAKTANSLTFRVMFEQQNLSSKI